MSKFKQIMRLLNRFLIYPQTTKKIFEIDMDKYYPLTEEICKLAQGKRVLEFGAGHSTIKLAEAAKELVSIESDSRAIKIIQEFIADGSHVQLWRAFIGPVGAYGTPRKYFKPLFKYFYSSYYEKAFKKNSSYEIVFVDGRFRVACMIQAYLNLTNTFTLVCDDFFNRPEYHVVLELFGKPQAMSGSAAMWDLTPESMKMKRAEEILLKFRYVSD